MKRHAFRLLLACSVTACCLLPMLACMQAASNDRTQSGAMSALEIVEDAAVFAPGVVSTAFSEVRLTLSPDGRTALWFSRDRPGGAGGYDVWMSHRVGDTWTAASPVPFNSAHRDFDPAFSSDGRHVYFCSDRPGGLGGDDLYRVAVVAQGFGEPEHLGADVNSTGNEFAPMPSPDRRALLFSSDRPGGAGRHDLYIARHRDGRFAAARRLPGDINTSADEFDATFLADGATIVFARAPDLRTDRVDLYAASLRDGRYDVGRLLPQTVNSGGNNTYGPMLDWSRPDRFTISAQRAGAGGMDLYLVRYALRNADRPKTSAGDHAMP